MKLFLFALFLLKFQSYAIGLNKTNYYAGENIYLNFSKSNKLEFIHPFGKIILKNNTNQGLINSSLTKMHGQYLIQSGKQAHQSISINHLKASTLNIIPSASIIDVTHDGLYSIHAFSLDQYSNIVEKQSTQFYIEYPDGEVFTKSCEYYNLFCFTEIGNLKKSGVVTIKAESSSIKSNVSLLQQTAGPVFSYKINSKKTETIDLKNNKFFIKLDNIKDKYNNNVANGTKINLIVFSENNISQTIERVTIEGSTSFYFTAPNSKKIMKVQITSNKFKSAILYEEFI